MASFQGGYFICEDWKTKPFEHHKKPLIFTCRFLVSVINVQKVSKKIMEAFHSPPSDYFGTESSVLCALLCGCQDARTIINSDCSSEYVQSKSFLYFKGCLPLQKIVYTFTPQLITLGRFFMNRHRVLHCSICSAGPLSPGSCIGLSGWCCLAQIGTRSLFG